VWWGGGKEKGLAERSCWGSGRRRKVGLIKSIRRHAKGLARGEEERWCGRRDVRGR